MKHTFFVLYIKLITQTCTIPPLVTSFPSKCFSREKLCHGYYSILIAACPFILQSLLISLVFYRILKTDVFKNWCNSMWWLQILKSHLFGFISVGAVLKRLFLFYILYFISLMVCLWRLFSINCQAKPISNTKLLYWPTFCAIIVVIVTH